LGIKYTIDRVKGLVRGQAQGVLTSEQLRDQYARLMADPALRHDYRELVDLRAVTDVQVEEHEIRAAARMYVFDAGTRRACVARSEPAYRFAISFASHAQESGQHLQVFRSLEEAEEWLELGVTLTEPRRADRPSRELPRQR
jgi:hypothetical protein